VNATDYAGRSLTYPALALTYLMGACGGEQSKPDVMAEVDTIGGVVVVRNATTGLWRESEEWEVVEAFRVDGDPEQGDVDPELAYSDNVGVTLGPNGQIFVIQYSSDHVVVFSGDGDFVRSFGGTGEGPGELRGPMAMAWDAADRLWVADARGRYHVYDSTGTFQKSVPRPFFGVRRILHPLLWQVSGTLVEEAANDKEVLYLRFDTLGNVVDTAAVIPTPQQSPGFQGLMFRRSWNLARFVVRHYDRSLRWSLAPDGTIWSAETGQLRLVQTTPGGDTIRIVTTSHRTAEFDRRDRATIADGLKEAGVSERDVELVRPVFGGIHVMGDGHVLVEIIERVGEYPSTVDVFNPEGLFLGNVDLGFGLSDRNLPALVGDTIIAVTPGTLDVPHLVRATIKRPLRDPRS